MPSRKAWKPGGAEGPLFDLLRKYGVSGEEVLPREKTGGTLYFEGMTPGDAQALIDLGVLDVEESTETSPTTEVLLELSDQFPGIEYGGYRVLPPRKDERITLTGFRIPSQNVGREGVFDLANMHPDHLYEEEGWVHASWE